MNFELKIIDLYWINEGNDDPTDLCLHGKVFVRIGDEIIDDGSAQSDWTVSAGAYRMLESLYHDHIAGNEEHLLPCCGHFMFINEKTSKLVISGCANGLDWSVVHENDLVKLMTNAGTQINISFREYKNIVLEFADKIKLFYDKCSSKLPQSDFENETYQRFWTDWEILRNDNPTV